jgi:DNA-binding transcriptional MerR regulator
MRIGDLSDACGLPTRTIRFYERRGLLPDPSREPNGYRVYDETTLGRVSFIRSAQSAGLTLAEIRSILDIRDTGRAPCSHVGDLLAAKLDEVQHRRAQLETLEAELHQLIVRSRLLDPADCGEGEICHILRPTGIADPQR